MKMDSKFHEQIENNFLIRKIKTISISPISARNINSTYKIEAEGANYILQKINKFVFKKPEQVMQNIRRVSRFLENKVLKEGGNPRKPEFHNTPKRFRDFEKALEKDKAGRVKEIERNFQHPLRKVIDYILSQKEELGILEDGKLSGELPMRVTQLDIDLFKWR